MTRPTKVEILLPSLRRNLSLIRRRSAEGRESPCRVIAVVKADAYGHGAVEVSKELARNGVDRFAVACLEEAVELADAGALEGEDGPVRIIILGPLRGEELGEIGERGFIPVVSCFEDLKLLDSALAGSGKKLSVIAKIDLRGVS